MKLWGLIALLLSAPLRAGVVVERVQLGASSSPSISPLKQPGLTLSAGALAPSPLSAASIPLLTNAVPEAAAAVKAASPAPALSENPVSAPAVQPRGRGPPTAKDEGFGAHVAETVAVAARSWTVPAEEIFDDHDALLVGESHHSLASVNELAANLPRLAASGVKVVGIEGLKRPSQPAVDAYLSRETSELPEEAVSFSPARAAAFKKLFHAAREQGVRVVALGLPLDVWARETVELAGKRVPDPVETFPADVGSQLQRAQDRYEPGFNEAVAEVYLTRRNESMANFLAGAMEAGVKAVVIVGQNHIGGLDDIPARLMRAPGDWGTLGGELAKLGLKAFSLTMTGGLYTSAGGAEADRFARPAAHERAKSLSPDGSPAFARTSRSSGVYHAGGRVPSAH